MALPDTNPFPGLTQQVLSAAAAVKGLTTVVSSAQQAVAGFSNVVGGVLGGAFKKILHGFDQLATATVRAVAGLSAMGVAGLAGGVEVFGQVLGVVTAAVGGVVAPVFVSLAAA